MTATEEDIEMRSVLALTWQRHRQDSLDRITLIEAATADVLRSILNEEAILVAAGAAHQLAGSLGIFGFDAGSRAALEAERLLRGQPINGRMLAEAVVALRSSVRSDSEAPVISIDRPAAGVVPAEASTAALVISTDVDLVSRLTVEAAAVGLSLDSASQLTDPPAMATGRSAVIFDEARSGLSSRSGVLASVAATSDRTAAFVLTEHDTFEVRAEYARAGASGIIVRTQSPTQIIAFVAESVALRQPASSVVLAFNVDDGLEGVLTQAFAESECQLDIRSSAEDLWEALEEQGADMVVVGYGGSQLSGPDLCRVVRAHPHWHRVPVVVMGARVRSHLDESFAAGADDYLSVGTSAHDLGLRLRHLVTSRKLAEARSDADPVTGLSNRAASEEATDRLFGLARDHEEPFSLALVTIDQFQRIRSSEGTAMANTVLRRLGDRLLTTFQGRDFAGRWSEDGFVVGVTGASGVGASLRIGAVLDALTTEGIATTSGDVVHYTFSGGIASAPDDGSQLASLVRASESALERASRADQAIVVSGDRPGEHERDVVDVVLVDDDDAIADVIEHAMGLRHYSYLRFSDGAEAASALAHRTVRAKVILLDIGLPSLDGFGVLHALRDEGVADESRVMMLTARSSEGEMLRAIGLGAAETITKPFSIPVLLARLERSRVGAMA